ncbi:MAG: metallophosphoesterase [Pleurocapsa sp.]
MIKTIKNWISYGLATVGGLLICCYLYGTILEPNWIEIVPINLTIPHLSESFNNFKLVQISDIHLSDYMPKARLDKIARLVNQQQADAVVITGDFITRKHKFVAENLIEFLNQINSSEVTLSVMGNHDRQHREEKKLEQALIKSKVINLDNQIYVIHRDTEKLIFAGIDDPYVGQPDLTKVVEQLTDNSPVILLVHQPDFVDISAKTGKFALQLSGHSHGGQIKMPFLPPSFLPPGGQKYFAGLNQVDHTLVYTNRGLGMTAVPIRFNSRPEITVFTFKIALSY